MEKLKQYFVIIALVIGGILLLILANDGGSGSTQSYSESRSSGR